MNKIKMGSVEMSIPGLLYIVGGLIAFIALFLTYLTKDPILGNNVAISGLDVFQSKFGFNMLDSGDYTFVHNLPLIIAILGAVTLVIGIIPMFTKVDGKVFAIIGLILGILTLVLGIWFVAAGEYGVFTQDAADIIKIACKMTFGVGAYLGIVGGIIATIGGVLDLKENKVF